MSASSVWVGGMRPPLGAAGLPLPFAVLLALLLGCGGEVAGAPDASPPDAGPEATADANADDDVIAFPDSAGGQPPMGTCPTDPPTAGAPCMPVPSVFCEYGGEISPTCDQLFACDYTGCLSGPLIWRQIGLTASCPITVTQCPASFDDALDGGSGNARCLYSAGVCGCGSTCTCVPAPSACPKPRPRLGTPCAAQIMLPDRCPFEATEIATYPCSFDGYVCARGVWTATLGHCALPPPCR